MRVVRHLNPPGTHSWDYDDGDNPVAERYNVHELPTLFLLDRRGVIRARDPGVKELVAAVESAMKGEPESPKRKW